MSAIATWKNSTILAQTAGLSSAMLTNSATVGSDKTFEPAGFQTPGVARWEDRSGGVAAGFPNMTLSMRRPTKQSRIYKVQFGLAIPRMAATSTSTNTGIEPAPSVAYTCQAKLECLIPERSTAAERVLFFSELIGAFAASINASDGTPADVTGSPLFATIVNLESPY